LFLYRGQRVQSSILREQSDEIPPLTINPVAANIGKDSARIAP
jgi:hypothetical protein